MIDIPLDISDTSVSSYSSLGLEMPLSAHDHLLYGTFPGVYILDSFFSQLSGAIFCSSYFVRWGELYIGI